MEQKREIIKSNLDPLLLSLINKQPMYGYQIIKELDARSQGYFKFKEGTLYPALHRLENSKLVESKWQILPNGQQRKYYYLTDKGLASLAERKNLWQDFFVAVNLIMQGE